MVTDLKGPSAVQFMPYLGGERTPHNDVAIRGGFQGLAHETGETDLTHAVLDGVAFALMDCLGALTAAGSSVTRVVELRMLAGRTS